MRGEGDFANFIEPPGCGIGFKLSIPIGGVELGKPFPEARTVFCAQASNLFFDVLQHSHVAKSAICLYCDRTLLISTMFERTRST